MCLRYHRYINKPLLCVSFAAAIVAFLLLNTRSYEVGGYSSYQHPFLTLMIIGLYILMIAKLDFTGSMFVSRFQSPAKCMTWLVGAMSCFSAVYYSALLGAFILLSWLLNGAVSVESAVLCFIYGQITLVLVNVLYVVLSFKIGKLFAQICLYSAAFLGFAMNFAGEIFVRYNFFFFNMFSQWNQRIFVDSLITYTGLIFLLALLLQKKDKEL